MKEFNNAPLNSYTLFRQNIEPYLACISAKQRAHTATELYRLCQEKIGLERGQSFAPESVSDGRTAGNQFERTGAHLNRARKEVEKARACLEEDLQYFHAEDFGWDELLEKINLGLQTAVNWRKFYTATIHPDLRTPAEKRLIEPRDEVQEYTYPGKGVTASDYWFIGRAEQLLKQCRSKKGEELRPVNYHRIISKTFDAAFNQPKYTEKRVKTALRRIRQRPRLKYSAPWAVPPGTKSLK
jgi:hypothetical protein